MDSRGTPYGTFIRRRRECLKCGHRATTWESYYNPDALEQMKARVTKLAEQLVKELGHAGPSDG